MHNNHVDAGLLQEGNLAIERVLLLLRGDILDKASFSGNRFPADR
jgi:hypothetical protein